MKLYKPVLYAETLQREMIHKLGFATDIYLDGQRFKKRPLSVLKKDYDCAIQGLQRYVNELHAVIRDM